MSEFWAYLAVLPVWLPLMVGLMVSVYQSMRRRVAR